ncbi:putative steroid dehydrogenase [Aspergillus heteromorphus CBS 117.55]|uniref:3-dehydrosphinganine reductase n=1 Tax=Aspergillus heteromorphus CBS 117.55 TaxID=1448321 RepID=A0A317WYQ5_9EURO|nr:putative steroid dehydrogenase [Aspergillus heteromorphus CBS 117.55]PWY89858.1 putative steroid dehydrogenase [Aspergillus heteromorphus CBS 117.55]
MKRTSHFDVHGQTVLIAGGSKGLGRELALQLTAEGANVTILARSSGPLEETRREMLTRVQHPDQAIAAHPVDLTDATEVESLIATLKPLPTILFCVAGGTAEEIGFFADISSQHIKTCMDRNYLSAAYIAHALLCRWLAEPPKSADEKSHPRHLIFTASTAAFLGLPGYVAYTPTKAATRALADTLRQEVLLYRSQQEIRVHCSFPGTIYTEAYVEEQRGKPELLKELEGDGSGLSPAKVAEKTIHGLKQGRFFITMDFDTELLLNNMRGPSPRFWAVWDWSLGLVGSLAWPFYRWWFDRRTGAYGREMLGGRSDR